MEMTRAIAAVLNGHRRGPVKRIVRFMRQAAALRRQRRALAALDARMLRDIGLTETDARKEAQRPPWDVPHTWRQ